jgi:hypothetical protein
MIIRGSIRMTVFTLCLLSLVGTGFSSSSGEPEILPDRVVFAGGKILRYETSKILQREKSAIGRNEVASFKERPVVLRRLKRVVLVREETLSEGGSLQLSVYDFAGTLLGSSEKVAVEAEGLFFLETQKRIFVGQSSSHTRTDTSFLYDENGRLVRRIPQPAGVAGFGHSGDERLIWIVSNVWVPPGKKIGELRVTDSDGHLLAREEFDRAQTITMRHMGRTYKIPVRVPSLP